MNTGFMQRAIDLSFIGMREGKGGPFGAVVVKDGEIVGEGYNMVTSTNDPTAHGEVVAIRDACRNLGTFDLTGCELYTSSEPCLMCNAVTDAANIVLVYYANTIEQAAQIGFADVDVYKDLMRQPSKRRVQVVRLEHPNAILAFQEWAAKADKVSYFATRS